MIGVPVTRFLIGVPVTRFLTERELHGWYERAGLDEIAVVQTGGGRGWSGSGVRRGASPR